MADNNVIGILFGVAGEGSINGESGRLIKQQLEQIAREISDKGYLKVKINADTTEIKKQIEELAKYVQSQVGKPINIRANVNSGNTGGGNEPSDTKAKELDKAYNALRTTLKNYYKVQTQITKEHNKSTEKSKVLQEQLKTLSAELEKVEQSFNANKGTQGFDAKAESIRRYKEQLESALVIQQQQSPATAQDKSLKNMQKSYLGLIANVESLNERYADLIKHNKDAATAMAKLKALSDEQYLGGDHLDKDGNLVAGNYTEGANQVDKLAKELKRTSAEMSRLEANSNTLGKKLRETFGSKMVQTFAYALIGLATRALKQVYDNVVKLDAAVTDLQIATGKTRAATKELVAEYANLAKQLGATVLEVTSAADTWLRQGYSIADTNTLITNTLMLSKLGQLESADAARALTSAMKGYKVSVEECVKIVDKFTAVDMEAAASAGDIATAMAETATSADIAGVSMNKLIGYITTVKEVTQDGSESVGTFYKTLFARMGNVKAGKFVDDETGESLNDVEKVLEGVGISLRDSRGLFRDFGNVLDDVAGKWEEYNNVQQHAIATAFAGTRQQEKFIVLMENYGDALDYANTAANSSGTAQSKYDSAYMDSIEARINELKAAWESFSQSLLDSEVVKAGASALTGIVNVLDWIISNTNILQVAVSALFALGITKAITGVANSLTGLQTAFGGIGKFFKTIGATIAHPKKALKDFNNEIKSLKSALKTQQDILAGAQKDLDAFAETTGYSSKELMAHYDAAVESGDAHNYLQTTLGLNTEQQNQMISSCSKLQAAESGVNVATNQLSGAVTKAGIAISTALGTVTMILGLLNMFEGEAAEISKIVISSAIIIVGAIALIVVATKAGAKAIGVAIKSIPIIGWIAAIISAIMTLISAITSLVGMKSYETQKEELEDLKEEYEKLKEEVDELNTSLEENYDRMSELQALKDSGIITTEEENELNILKAQTAELERQLLLEKEKLELKGEGVYNSTQDTYDRYTSGEKDKFNEYLSEDDLGGEDGRAFINEYLTEIQSLTDGMEYYLDAAEGSWQEKSNQLLEEVWKSEDKFLVATGKFNEVWDALTYRDNFSEAIDVLKLFANEVDGNLDTALAKFDELKEHPAIKDFIEYLTEIGAVSLENEDSLKAFINQIMQLESSVEEVNPKLREFSAIATQIANLQDVVDLLKDAKKETSELGIISADTMTKLLEMDPSLITEGYFERVADGYRLAEGALDKYYERQKEKATEDYNASVAEELEKHEREKASIKAKYDSKLKSAKTEAEYNNLIREMNAELTALDKNTNSVLKSIAETYDDTINGLNATIDILEREEIFNKLLDGLDEQQEMLEGQIDLYKDLVDVRKELIETYADEVNYKKTLATKQKAVADLQTQLALARLDTSASGQARAAELQSQLTSAQEDLEEYTLERAIDDVCAEIESAYVEFKTILEAQIDRITTAISDSTTLSNEAIKNILNEWDSLTLNEILDRLSKAGDSEGDEGSNAAGSSAPPAQVTQAPTVDSQPEQKKEVTWKTTGKLSGVHTTNGFLGAGHLSGNARKNDDIDVQIGDKNFDLIAGDVAPGALVGALNTTNGGTPKAGDFVLYDGALYVFDKKGNWRKPQSDSDSVESAIAHYITLLNQQETHHTGGFAGDMTSLKSNEVFAKLLKGEFVATPAQMDKFMKETLPMIALSGSTGVAEINNNSPLIEIHCGNIDKNSMPELENLVAKAVQQIEQKMKSALSRTGYRK